MASLSTPMPIRVDLRPAARDVVPVQSFTRLVTVTIGSSGAVTRSVPDPGDRPRFGVGPIGLSVDNGRISAVVPLHISRAGAFDPDRLAIEAAGYADEAEGRLTFLALENPSMAWRTPPRKGQRDGVSELVIESNCPPIATGLCVRISYAGDEQCRVLKALEQPNAPK